MRVRPVDQGDKAESYFLGERQARKRERRLTHETVQEEVVWHTSRSDAGGTSIGIGYSFYSGSATVTVSEPMTVAPYYVSSDVTWDGNNYTVNLDPGKTVRLGWDVTNNGSVALNVKPSVTPGSGDGGNITTEWVMTHDLGDGSQTVDPAGTERFTLVIRANGSTAPGTYTFTITLDRS